MTYDQALLIAARNFSDLWLDPPHPDLPWLFAVRKTKGGIPFSIHLPQAIDVELTPEAALAQETESLLVSLGAARKQFA